MTPVKKKTLNGGIKLKTNRIHGLNIIFLLLMIEKIGSAIEYYFNKIVGLEKKLKSELNKEIIEDTYLYCKIIS